jgi:hypothetical protein
LNKGWGAARLLGIMPAMVMQTILIESEIDLLSLQSAKVLRRNLSYPEDNKA